jgi:diketogulonate reductase-like aldo/keto reductase
LNKLSFCGITFSKCYNPSTMKFETIGEIKLPKIGFGTWRIGGGSSADRSADSKSLAALRSALELGYTHFDTAEMYADGHAEELLGQAMRESGLARNSLFITSKVKAVHLQYDQLLRACEASLRRLGLEYLDLYLIHWPSAGMKLADAFRALNKLVADGKVRHLGVSNFDLKLLKEARQVSQSPLLTDQVPYSLADREYVKNGILDYCKDNNILLTAYSPLEIGKLRSNQNLLSIALAHGTTPDQIALAWLVSQPGVITIPMSSDPEHQAANLGAADLVLTAEESKQLERIS